MPPGIARYARGGWNLEGASLSARHAGITCPARITINRGVVALEAGGDLLLLLRKRPLCEMFKNSYASRFRLGLPPDPCMNEEEPPWH